MTAGTGGASAPRMPAYCSQRLLITDADSQHAPDSDPCMLACCLPPHDDTPDAWHYDEMDDVTWREGDHVAVEAGLRELVAEILDDFWPGERFEGEHEGLAEAQARVDGYRKRAGLPPMGAK